MKAVPERVDYLLSTGRWEMCETGGVPTWAAVGAGLAVIAVIFIAAAGL